MRSATTARTTTTTTPALNDCTANVPPCSLTVDKTCQEVVPPVSADVCASGSKPTALVFEYTGDDCSASNNPQGGKAKCSGNSAPLGEPVEVVLTKDANKMTVDPTGQVINVGGPVTISGNNGGKLRNELKLDVRQGGDDIQVLAIHTSCSKDLFIGDRFGSLLLVEATLENGEVIGGGPGSTPPAEHCEVPAGGADIEYAYTVNNTGSIPVVNVVVNDDVLGPVGVIPSIAPFTSATVSTTVFVGSSVTNIADVSGSTADGALCGASDAATVVVGGDVPSTCGDGILDPGEECDDGNNDSGDGCSAICVQEPEA